MEAIPIAPEEFVRYTIYARRSKESDEAQKASIPQQLEAIFRDAEMSGIPLRLRPESAPPETQTLEEIAEAYKNTPDKCRDITEKYIKYHVITERKSAKRPGERKEWSALIQNILSGEIRGLYGYCPDRHARNLQEGGQVMDLVSQRLIRLKYSHFPFENNSGGHTMLGFAFVLASSYSHKLSEDSTRSIKQKTLEGIVGGTKKTGYKSDKDENGQDFWVPDEPNFTLLKKGFSRKLIDNWSDERIAKEMMQNGWSGSSPIKGKYISNRDIWSDPFFYGIWRREFHDGTVLEVDLRQIPEYNFTPAITEKNYFLLQEALVKRNRKSQEFRQSLVTKRLDCVTPVPKGMIIDHNTKNPLQFCLPNPKRAQKRLEKLQESQPKAQLCDVVQSHQIKYSTKGNNISFADVDTFIARKFKKARLSPQDSQAVLCAQYERIQEECKQKRLNQKRVDLLLIKNAKAEEAFLSDSKFGKELSPREKAIYDKKIREFSKKESNLIQEKACLAKESRDEILEYQAFTDLLFNWPQLWKSATYVQKRKILEIFILNIEIKNGKPHKIVLNENFASIFPEKFLNGRVSSNVFEHIYNALAQIKIGYIRKVLNLYSELYSRKPEAKKAIISKSHIRFYGLENSDKSVQKSPSF